MSLAQRSVVETSRPIRSANLSNSEFDEIAAVVRSACGINLTANKMDLVHSRLQKRLRHLGMENFREYLDHVGSPAGANEFNQMISALTTNVTRFHREHHHFEHFENTCIPAMLKRGASGEPLRVWSAGCSNGSEAYNIAGVIAGKADDAARRKIKVLGTDIDIQSLAVARSGVYSREFIEGLPEAKLKKWFSSTPSGYSVNRGLRELVTFNTLNLIEDWPMRHKFDAIFCRNVMIYFDRELQEDLLARFVSVLKPGGYLYIGHSERVSGSAVRVLRTAGNTIYEKTGD